MSESTLRHVRIALVQQQATDNRDDNTQRGQIAVRQAAAAGAQIVCFAELAFDPFHPQEPATPQTPELAESIPGPTTAAFAELARELGVVIILNLFEISDGRTYDSSPVVGHDGQLLGTTRMIHITDYACFHERGYYTPGDHGAPVFETPFGRIGIAICYDRHFPEYMRALALGGAEIVFIPQAGAVGEWPEGLYHAEMQVASFQHGYYTALCNRVGPERRLTFGGESFVCDPHGRVIAQASATDDEILTCDLDLAEVGRSHAQRLFLGDRRPELYADWLGPQRGRDA